MIPAISNILTNNTLVNIAQSTRTAMSIETGLKATGRPAFILMDKNITPETKKYAAVKELIYQLTCLAVYMGVVMPVFRKGGFQLFKKVIFKNKEAFKRFNSLDEFSAYHKMSGMNMADRMLELNKPANQKLLNDRLKNELKNNTIKRKAYNIVKGADEFSSIIGSVLGLAVFAPQVSHVTINPILKILHVNNDKDSKKGH